MIRRLEQLLKRFLLLLFFRCSVGFRSPSALSTRAFKRILVIRQHDQLGDMLCVVPLLRGLRERYPDAHIDLITSPVNHDVMLNNPYINHIIRCDKQEFLGRASIKLMAFWKFVQKLREEKFELSIVPSTVSVSATSNLLAFLSGARCRIGASEINGEASLSGVFFNSPVKLDWRGMDHRHQTFRNLDIGKVLQLRVSDFSSTIRLEDEEIRVAREYLRGFSLHPGSFILFHPGAGKPPNRWPAENFAQLANRLMAETRQGALITHGPMDDEPVERMKSGLEVPFAVATGKSIREVAAILSLGRLLISNDTGIMHVAAAVGTPVLSLFGPTDPEQWAPIGHPHRYIRGREGNIDLISGEEVLLTAREMLR